MINNENWHTVTLLEICEKQGYINHAKRIYENLLKKDPNNIRLKKAYDKFEKHSIKGLYNNPSKELGLLFSEWIELMLKSKRLKDLNLLKEKYQEIRLAQLIAEYNLS